MKRRRLRAGETIWLLSAIALFVFMFLDWYDYKQTGGLLNLLVLSGFPASAWQILDVIPWLLLVAILVALGTAGLRLTGSKWEPAIPLSAVVAVLGGLATLLVGFRIVDPPEPSLIRELPVTITVELGAYLALAAAAGIAYGGYRAMGERGTSFAKVADSLSSERRRPGPERARRKSPPRERSASRRPGSSSSD